MRTTLLAIVLTLGACTFTASSDTPCINGELAIEMSDSSSAALSRAQAKMSDLNISGAAEDVREAARFVRRAADASADYDNIADPLYEAADLYDEAAASLDRFLVSNSIDDIDTATSMLMRAIEKVDESTAEIPTTDLTAC